MNLFENIYRKYSADVYRFAFWLSGDSDTAKDITSDTFMKIWIKKDNLHVETIRGLLFVTARNIFLQLKRSKSRHVPVDKDIPDGAAGPEEIIMGKDELSKVIRCLKKFPEIDRSALILKVEFDLSYAEISRYLGVSETAAKVKVHRVRQKLQKIMKGDING